MQEVLRRAGMFGASGFYCRGVIVGGTRRDGGSIGREFADGVSMVELRSGKYLGCGFQGATNNGGEYYGEKSKHGLWEGEALRSNW